MKIYNEFPSFSSRRSILYMEAMKRLMILLMWTLMTIQVMMNVNNSMRRY